MKKKIGPIFAEIRNASISLDRTNLRYFTLAPASFYRRGFRSGPPVNIIQLWIRRTYKGYENKGKEEEAAEDKEWLGYERKVHPCLNKLMNFSTITE